MDQDTEFISINILDMLEGKDEKHDRQLLEDEVSDFRCSRNPDIERFLKHSAIDFARKYQGITYLVMESERWQLVGYYTLTIKALTVEAAKVSKTVAKKLSRISEFDEIHRTYTVPAFLIGQLGKNEAVEGAQAITGSALLQMAEDTILEARRVISGFVVFLEANDHRKLRQFYEANEYFQFDTRETAPKDGEPRRLVQFMKLLR